jgi:hypothetical protein
VARCLQALEEVKLREVQIVEMQKKVQDGEARLRQQQSLYEAVRADRNSYSKNLIAAQVGWGWVGWGGRGRGHA